MKSKKQGSPRNVDKLILENVPEIVYFVKSNGDSAHDSVEFVSPSVRDIVGYEPEEFSKKPELWFSIIHPDDVQAIIRATEEMYTTKKSVPRRYRIRHRVTNEYVWIEDKPSPLLNRAGNITGYVGVARDVSNQKALEDAIHRNEPFAQTFVHSHPDALLMVDAQGRIVQINDRCEEMFGYSEKELSGKSIEDLVPSHFQREHFRLRKDFFNDPKPRVMGSGLQIFGQHKNGRTIPIDIALGPFKRGGSSFVLCVVRDISEQKRTLQALQESEEQYRAVVEQASESIFLVDAETLHVISSNCSFEKILGYSTDEVHHLSLYDFIAHDKESIDKNVNLIIKQERHSIGERKYKKKDGSLVDVEVTAHMVHQKGKEVICCLVRDITDRKRAEEALKLFRTLVDRSNDAIEVLDPETGRFLDINEKGCQDLGYTREEILSLSLFDIDPSVDRSFFIKAKEDFQKSSVLMWQGIHRRKDGSTFPVEVNIKYVQLDRDYIVTVVRNITERNRTEEALRENEKRYRSIVENLTQAYYEADRRAAFTYCNPGLLLISGHTEEELLGTISFRLVAEEHRQRVMASYKRWIDEKRTDISIEFMAQTKHGRAFWVEQTTHFEFDSSGRLVKATNILRDIDDRKRTEQQLAASETRLRTIIEAEPECVKTVAPDGTLLSMNRAGLEMIEADSPEQVVGKSVFAIIAPDHREAFVNLTRRVCSGEKEIMQFELVGLKGTQRWMDTHAVPLRDEHGQINGMLAITRDITKRKQVEEKNRLLAHTIESISEIACITDLNDRFIFVNNAFLDKYGYTPEEIIGQRVEILRSPNISSKLYSELLDQTRRGGWKGELLNVTKDGREFPVSLRTSQIKDDKGAIIGLVGIAEDITERKKAEEAIRESEARYRTFFEDDLTADYIATSDGRLLECNPAFVRMFGFSSHQEALATNTIALHPNIEKREELLSLLRLNKRLEYHGLELRRMDGKPVYVVANLTGLFDEKGTLTKMRGYLFDDTRRRDLETQLIQAQKLESLGTLAGGIAHDFNNILAIIMGHSSLLMRIKQEPEKVTQSLEAIVKATERGASLVKQLLTFARKAEALFESVRVNDSIVEIIKLLHETFPKTITISTSFQPELPSINADATQIHQVLLNLCVNARDAMPQGGTLSISTSTMEGELVNSKFPKATARRYIRIELSDTGAGMDEAIRRRIFEPFFTTKEPGKGTGLGLALVFSIVENHGGFIDLQSKLGEGTTFSLYLPISEDFPELPLPTGTIVEDITGGTETILVIEDEEILRDLVDTVLTSKGYKVLTAEDGMQGIEVFAKHQKEIALVLSDIGLPVLGGLGVLKKIREINPKAKVIFASGFIDPELKIEMHKAGAEHFIHKPYSHNEVLQKIREVIDAAQ